MTMKELAWLMPLLFILHDMEEIVLGMAWKKKEPALKKYTKVKLVPFGTSKDTAGMSFAIYEELLLLCLSALIGVCTSHYEIWFGFLAGNILHIITLHMILVPLKYRCYVPGLLSSVLTLFPNIWMYVSAARLLHYRFVQIVLYSVIGMIIAMANLKLLHRHAHSFSDLIDHVFAH